MEEGACSPFIRGMVRFTCARARNCRTNGPGLGGSWRVFGECRFRVAGLYSHVRILHSEEVSPWHCSAWALLRSPSYLQSLPLSHNKPAPRSISLHWM